MPEPAEYGLTETDLKVLRWVVAQVRSGQFQFESGGRRPPWGVYRAKTVGAHAANTTQAVQLCDSSWAAISGETPDATNDSDMEIPDDKKLYCVPGGNESLLIITAFVCSDPP